MTPAIRVLDLWKGYQIGGPARHYDTFYDLLAGAIKAPFRRIGRPCNEAGSSRKESFWALRELEFTVAPGEVVGIVGRNGAGKSTLLKILSRITEPTRGRVEIRGRVASLLEVGTGFHPELTGRENIYLNGAILGMTRSEIQGRFDEIVAFAEIDKFLDTPVKRYSSGMYVRLAFAVAAHVEPDVLLIDEVLAVGDATFQSRCLAKMGQVKAEGRTVVFVSHNMTAIQSLCSSAVRLEGGQVRESGPAEAVIGNYLSEANTGIADQSWNSLAEAPGNDRVRVLAARATGARKEGHNYFRRDEQIELVFEFLNLDPESHLNLTLNIYDEANHIAIATATNTDPNWHGKAFPLAMFRSSCTIPASLLNAQVYRVELLVVRSQSEVVFRHPEILVLPVQDTPDPTLQWHGRWPGSLRPTLSWTTELIGET